MEDKMAHEILIAISDFSSRVDERFDLVDKRFEAVDRRFEAVDKRFEALEGRVGHLENQMVTKDYLDNKLADFKADIGKQQKAAYNRDEHLVNILTQKSILTVDEAAKVLKV